MSKKNKFYIPLVGKTGGTTLINAEKIPDIKELIPTIEEMMLNLISQKPKMEKGAPYSPLMVRVSEEKFADLEKQIRQKKAGHVFVKKAFDIISDTKTQLPIVQIIQA